MNNFLSVAEQLQVLFEAVQHPSGRAYTMQEVSDSIDVSPATLSQLRTGKIKNPQLNTLREICRFFDVPLRYFETRSVEECYALLADGREDTASPLNEIAFRATQLSPESQRDVLTIIRWVEAAESQRQRDGKIPPLPNLERYDDED
jgi:transcriptional regulator with XRE-family HTH domain